MCLSTNSLPRVPWRKRYWHCKTARRPLPIPSSPPKKALSSHFRGKISVSCLVKCLQAGLHACYRFFPAQEGSDIKHVRSKFATYQHDTEREHQLAHFHP